MKTTIHEYNYDISNPSDKRKYENLCAILKDQGVECFKSCGNGSHYDADLDRYTLELETDFLFDNQWNTAPIDGAKTGLRVFDWAEDAIFYDGRENKIIKRGHYLEQTAEMREIRRNTLKCGYCGNHEAAAKGLIFCPKCIDSEYLTKEDLLRGATRLTPVDHGSGNWTPLTEAEQAHLLPLYKEAQLHGTTERGKAREIKQRRDIIESCANKIAAETAERDGMLWLLDHGVNINNVIYYSHTKKFCFGWRRPVSSEIESELLDIMSEFPFEYEIKAEATAKP